MAVEFNEEYLKGLLETTERSKSNSHRLDEVENKVEMLHSINSNIEKITLNMEYQNKKLDENATDIKEVKNEVNDIKNMPIKNKANIVDGFWKLVLTAIGTGLIAFVLGQVLPNVFSG